MDDREQQLCDVIKEQLQNQYRHMAEIARMTQEMKEAFDRNDKISGEMILDMRGEEMEQYDQYRHNLETLFLSMNEIEEREIKRLLEGETDIQLWPERIEELKNLVLRIRYNREKARKLDQAISLRLAGNDSFYHIEK